MRRQEFFRRADEYSRYLGTRKQLRYPFARVIGDFTVRPAQVVFFSATLFDRRAEHQHPRFGCISGPDNDDPGAFKLARVEQKDFVFFDLQTETLEAYHVPIQAGPTFEKQDMILRLGEEGVSKIGDWVLNTTVVFYNPDLLQKPNRSN